MKNNTKKESYKSKKKLSIVLQCSTATAKVIKETLIEFKEEIEA